MTNTYVQGAKSPPVLPPGDGRLLDPADPAETARAFLAAKFTQSGKVTLRRYGELFYSDGSENDVGLPLVIPLVDLTAQVWQFLEVSWMLKNRRVVRFIPKKATVGNVIYALRCTVRPLTYDEKNSCRLDRTLS